MENTDDSLLSNLTKLYQQVLQAEKVMVQRVINLQRIINHPRQCHTVRKDKNKNTISKEKKIVPEKCSIDIDQEVQKMLSNAQDKLKDIYNPNPNKQKIQPPTLPAIEKKPPIPTANRVQANQRNAIRYPIHPTPKKKNEVTGKITEMPIQKKKILPHNSSNSSLSKKKKQQSQIPPIQSDSKLINKPLSNQKQSYAEQKEQVQVKECKILIGFRKQAQALSKQVQGLHHQFEPQKFIDQYHRQSLGYKGKQQQKRMNFLKHFYQHGQLRNSVYQRCLQSQGQLPSSLQVTTKLQRRGWDGNQEYNLQNFLPVLDEWSSLLDTYEAKLKQDIIVTQCEKYYLHTYHSEINSHINNILALKDSIQVPTKLDLNFTYIKEKQVQNDNLQGIHHNEKMQNIRQFYLSVFDQLIQLADEVSSCQSLTGSQLNKIRMLSSLSIFENKRSPAIMQAAQYQKWKNEYIN